MAKIDRLSPWANPPCAWVWSALKAAGRPLLLRDLADRLGWRRPTVVRLLWALRRAGLVECSRGRWTATGDMAETLAIYRGQP